MVVTYREMQEREEVIWSGSSVKSRISIFRKKEQGARN